MPIKEQWRRFNYARHTFCYLRCAVSCWIKYWTDLRRCILTLWLVDNREQIVDLLYCFPVAAAPFTQFAPADTLGIHQKTRDIRRQLAVSWRRRKGSFLAHYVGTDYVMNS